MADIERLLVEALDDLEMYMGLLAEGGPELADLADKYLESAVSVFETRTQECAI